MTVQVYYEVKTVEERQFSETRLCRYGAILGPDGDRVGFLPTVDVARFTSSEEAELFMKWLEQLKREAGNE